MNRRIKKHIHSIKQYLDEIELLLDDKEPTEEVFLESPDGTEKKDTTNWSSADEEAKDSVYMKDLRELTKLKGLTIIGEITTVFDLKSYVGKDGEPGLIYRLVLSDPTGDVMLISFDDMAKELKQYTIGQKLKLTNCWKMQENKHGKRELHVGNFAKVEVVE